MVDLSFAVKGGTSGPKRQQTPMLDGGQSRRFLLCTPHQATRLLSAVDRRRIWVVRAIDTKDIMAIN